jgi:hypothetical protein
LVGEFRSADHGPTAGPLSGLSTQKGSRELHHVGHDPDGFTVGSIGRTARPRHPKDARPRLSSQPPSGP